MRIHPSYTPETLKLVGRRIKQKGPSATGALPRCYLRWLCVDLVKRLTGFAGSILLNLAEPMEEMADGERKVDEPHD